MLFDGLCGLNMRLFLKKLDFFPNRPDAKSDSGGERRIGRDHDVLWLNKYAVPGFPDNSGAPVHIVSGQGDVPDGSLGGGAVPIGENLDQT